MVDQFILNQSLMLIYWKALISDIGIESVMTLSESEHASLGDRGCVLSLLLFEAVPTHFIDLLVRLDLISKESGCDKAMLAVEFLAN